MRPDGLRTRVLRAVAGVAVAAAGIITLIGSGGGAIGFPEIDWGGGGGGPTPPYVQILPSRPTVQAGTIVQFEAKLVIGTPPISYRWARDGVEIAGATGPTYTLGGAQLGDDGARFQVTVSDATGMSSTAGAFLLVSPLPGVVFQDADFPVTNWTVTAVAQPAVNGPAHAESQASDGGNPGAYRRINYAMTPGPSSLRLEHFEVAASYNPAAQGAIYTIDLACDCSRSSIDSGVIDSGLTLSPAFEQSGRTYEPRSWYGNCQPAWGGPRLWSLRADDFLFSGPACGATEQCPDFSATAAPLRFGFVTKASLAAGSPAGSVVQGVDNWKVTVWRK